MHFFLSLKCSDMNIFDKDKDQILNAHLADPLVCTNSNNHQVLQLPPASKQHLVCNNPIVYFIWPDLDPSFNTQAIDLGLASVSPEREKYSRIQQETAKLQSGDGVQAISQVSLMSTLNVSGWQTGPLREFVQRTFTSRVHAEITYILHFVLFLTK